MKIEEAKRRLFDNMFVCQKCKHKQRANSQKIREGKINCRNCGAKAFRPKRKEKKTIG
jgi:ribosomal protein L40E|tara:strand:- start:274 stop:447 length:174 start_codon:yes stop_codon:yes gene_type:complete